MRLAILPSSQNILLLMICKDLAGINFNKICYNIYTAEGSHMKVLVIDDDPSMTDLIKMMLRSAASNVWTTNSGAEGIALAKSSGMDVIVLDLMMPEIDGWQVCKAVRVFSSVPILILSALDRPGMIASAMEVGANDYLIKPVASNALISHLKKLVN